LIEIEVATGAVIKTINKLSLADSSVGVTCTIIIRFFHNDQPLEKRLLKTTTLRVRVNDTEFKLEKEEMNYLREKLFDQYTWRERFEIVIDPKEKPASFPFDVVDIPLIIEMNSFNYKDDSNKKPGDEEEDDDEGEKEGVERYRVRFNQKMPKRRSTGINFKSTADQVPDFDIKKAPQYRSVEIQREEKKDGAYYPRVYFLFSLYRHPNTYICTSIIPLFLLNLCAIAVLFIPRDSFSDRMSAIVTLLLALFAFFSGDSKRPT